MRPSILLMLLFTSCQALALGPKVADNNAPYRIGDRLTQPAPGASSQNSYKETSWDMLIPEDWNPLRAFKGLNLAKLQDSDPRAMEALARVREMWDKAPVKSTLRGTRIRIAGFVVPLERQGNKVSEFLLVPYFGACIHVPPPPANQIIHVIASKALDDVQTMDAFWVSGTMDIGYSESPPWGVAGYQMKADVVVPYSKR